MPGGGTRGSIRTLVGIGTLCMPSEAGALQTPSKTTSLAVLTPNRANPSNGLTAGVFHPR